MDKLRQLKEIFPNYKTIDLSKIFRISPEAVRRILKSKFEKSSVSDVTNGLSSIRKIVSQGTS